MANLQTEFSLEEIEIARDVQNTYPCGLSRVVLNAPSQVFHVGSSKITDKHETGMGKITYRTLKFQYALEVWLRVVASSQATTSPLQYYWWINWKNRPNGFRVLVYNESVKYYHVDQENLIDEFMDQLRLVANSGEIKVHESYHPNLKTVFHDFADTCEPYYEVVVNAPTAIDIDHKIGPIADYNYNITEVSYCWEEIKEFFSVLSLNQLRLVNKDGLHYQSLWDKVLFQGASDCNIPMMQYAIDNGANTQSFDSLGESALVSAINNARFQGPDIKSAMIIETLDFLLSNGADINAFGVDGIPPLMAAYYAKSPELVRHLLELGANVNFNCYLMDYQNWSTLKQINSSLVYEIENDYSEDNSPEFIEVEKILIAAANKRTSQNPDIK